MQEGGGGWTADRCVSLELAAIKVGIFSPAATTMSEGVDEAPQRAVPLRTPATPTHRPERRWSPILPPTPLKKGVNFTFYPRSERERT